MKIVSKFFEDVHVVAYSSASLTILGLLSSVFKLDSAPLRSQFGCITEVVHVSALNLIGCSTGTVAIGTHRSQRLAMDLSVHIVMVVAIRILIEPIPFIRTML